MANETQTTNPSLKDERINETNTAANTTSTTTQPKAEEKTATTPPVTTTAPSANPSPKKDMLRMVGYPVVIGAIGGVGGMMLAKKLEKNNKVFIIGGVVVFAALGFMLYKRWEKKNSTK